MKGIPKPEGFEAVIEGVHSGIVWPVYTFIGEPPLTSPMIQELVSVLLPPPDDFNFELIQPENFSEAALMLTIYTPSMFSGKKVIQLNQPVFTAKKEESADKKKARSKKTPLEDWLSHPTGDVTLIFNTRSIDRRSSLFGSLKEAGPVLIIGDMGATERDKNSSMAAFIQEYVLKSGKKLEFKAIHALMELVGNDNPVAMEIKAIHALMELVGNDNPVAMENELKKLVSYAGGRTTITALDVQTIVGHQREEKLYELTQFLGTRQTDKALLSLKFLLEQGVYELVVLQAILNFIRRILFIKVVTQNYQDQQIDFSGFKSQILPDIETDLQTCKTDLFKSIKPYSLYNMFNASRQFTLKTLLGICADGASFDLALKGEASDKRFVLERLVLRVCRGYISR